MTVTPVIDTVQPDAAVPGDTVSVTGNNFGRKGRGRLLLGNKPLSGSAVLFWSDDRIDFRVPAGQKSILVFAEAGNRRSQGVLLTMEQELPDTIPSAYLPGYPWLENGEALLSYGDLLTLSGENLGASGGSVYWSSVELKPGDNLSSLQALPDSCIINWENRQVDLLLPFMTGEGFLYVKKGELLSNGIPLKFVSRESFVSEKSRMVTIEWHEQLSGFSAFGPNSLMMWYPLPPLTMTQQVFSHELNGTTLSPFNPEAAYREVVSNIESGGLINRKLVSRVRLSRNQFNYKADLGGNTWPKESGFEPFKVSSERIPSSSKSILDAVSGVLGREKRPLVRAKKLYDYTLARLRYRSVGESTVLKAQSVRRAVTPVYALHFISLLRAAGIPAREISGLLLLSDGSMQEHIWAEFFIPGLGWLTADPWLGDKYKPENWYDDLSPSLYFGGLDEYHLALFREGDAPVELWWNSRKMRGDYNFRPLDWTTESKGNIYRWESSLKGPVVTFENN